MNILAGLISIYLLYLLVITFIPFVIMLVIITIENIFKLVLGYKPLLTTDYMFDSGLHDKIVHYYLVSVFLPIAIPTYIIAYIIKWINQPEVKQRVKIEHNKANFKSILFKDDYNEHKIDYEIRKENIGKLCKYYDVALEIEPTVGDSWMRAIITPHQDMADYELLEFGDKLEKIWNES